MLNVLVTGSNGQIGSEIKSLSQNYNYHFIFTTKESLDITCQEDIITFCHKNRVDIIINTAAYTAVEKAEDDRDNANSVNHLAVKYLANIAKKKDISLIHISTDYVFDGNTHRPYMETDRTNPESVYGKTKLDGEKSMIACNPNHSIVIRTSWVYSSFGNNFVKSMLKLGKRREELEVIFDQVGTPTYARDLAQTILEILAKLDNKDVEIYHYTNEGVLSWYDFAKEIINMAKIDCKIHPIETKEYSSFTKRPKYSLLNKSKIKEKFNIDMPYWKDSLSDCLEKLERDDNE